MGRSLIQVYALCVCFVSLICFVVTLGIGLYDVVQITAPAFTVARLPYYQSNGQFLQYFPDRKDVSPGELDRLRDEIYRSDLAQERSGAMQSGVFVLIILLIDVTVYAVHWGIARKAER